MPDTEKVPPYRKQSHSQVNDEIGIATDCIHAGLAHPMWNTYIKKNYYCFVQMKILDLGEHI